MDTTDNNTEAALVRREIEASIALGTLTDDLVAAVHTICRRRCGPGLAEDVAQDVLVGLLRRLGQIDTSRDVSAYVGMSIVRIWRHHLRDRRVERRYLLEAAQVLIAEMPPESRVTAARAAFASAGGVFGLKYY